ncbi:MAG TPA: SpoIIE family protein phosphatase, partial [Thermoanaerobaculia bacterium]
MKIRTSLVLACFLLSVVPLGVIVVYSYYSSRHALQRAYHAEATRMTAQLDRRLSTIRDELQQRLAEVSALPDPSEGNVLMTMGDAASLVNSIEINPVAPTPPASAPTPSPAPAPHVVIRIPPVRVPRFTMTPGQRQQLKAISQLAGKMHQPGLTDDQRRELAQQISETQNEFSQSMQEAQKEFSKSIAEAVKQREEALKDAEQRRAEAIKEAEQQRREDAADNADSKAEPGQEVNVGNLQAHLSTKRLVHRILNTPDDANERDEIAFAIDKDGNVYTRNDADLQTLEHVGIPQRIIAGQSITNVPNWVVVEHDDPDTGVHVGVARPVGQDLEELRNTAAKNFGYGLALVFIALIGIVPVANHISGDIELVTRGAERIAHGDLTTRLPVRSNNEVGQLATAFNRMAQDLSVQQQRIVEQERAEVEYQRKSAELEEARRFQLSMLPKEVPQLDAFDIAAFTHTAAEVGGDYYDFHVEGGGLAITIGDATGHGARAGTMVAVIKALFAGYSDSSTPSEFLRDAAEKIRRMELGRMAMALLLARFQGRSVTLASAGMPPVYVHRRDRNAIEEFSIGATPLGTIGDGYRDTRIDLAAGDTLLFMSDGFPELMNEAGQQLGYGAAVEAFAAAAKADDAGAVIASLQNVARNWHGDQPPNDDVTFVVVRARESGRS